MAFDHAYLDQLKDRVGLADLIGRRVKLKRQGREWSGLCPFHDEKTPSFTVNESKGFYHCFGCGAHGSAIDFVMGTEGASFPDAVERLSASVGMVPPAPDPEAGRRRDAAERLGDVLEQATAWFQQKLAGDAGAAARSYLQGRGLDQETIERFRLGYAPGGGDRLKAALLARGHAADALEGAGLVRRPDDGRESYDFFRDRVIFPIADRRGRVIAFGGRALGEARAKYLNSPESPLFDKGRTLYNLASAREAAHRAGTIVVAEGYMDVIALHRAGVTHAVAPLGTALTEGQLAELWRLAPEPVLCFDGDAAGARAAGRAAERALEELRPGRSLGFVALPAGEDPDSLLAKHGRAALRDLLAAPRPLVDVLWEGALEGRNLDTPERRAGLRRDLGQLAGRIGDETVKAYYRDHFKGLLDTLFGAERPGAARHRHQGRGRAIWRDERQTDRRFNLKHGTDRLERLLLAVPLNHSTMLDDPDYFELFANLHLDSLVLDRLHGLIIETLATVPTLDVEHLRHNLIDEDLVDAIDVLTDKGRSGLPPSLFSVTGRDEAQKGWVEACLVHRLKDLEADLRAAEVALVDESTEANVARLNAVRVELGRARRGVA